MATNGDGFTDDSVKGPAGSKTQNKKLRGPFAYEKKIKMPKDDPELSKHVFKLPVDSEHKAKAINLFSVAQPHMRSFHLNWIAFFITFFSAYGAAPLIPTIRQDIGLTAYKANEAGELNRLHTFWEAAAAPSCDSNVFEIGVSTFPAGTQLTFLLAGVVTTAGTVVVRVLMGQACDKFGPRYGV